MRVRLVVPAGVDAPTGGNVYDLALAAAMRRDGDDVEVLPCAQQELAARTRPWDGTTLVDGLLACHQPDAVASGRAAVLVHMPLSLETGLSPDRAACLDRLEGQAMRAATAVITTSRWSAAYVARRHGLTGITVARPGVDPAPVGAGSDPPLFVQLAGLLPHKDQLGVVAALSRLTDLSWRARLAGSENRDPAYARAVREAVHAAGLDDRVEIPGVAPREAAWEGADLALLPSRVESYGMVVTEALARGIPAVVSAGTGSEEALGTAPSGERPGAVVPAGDPTALAYVLRRWLTDRPYRDALRTAALARRSTLEGWDRTAASVREALTRAG
jgi:glycosyltransferase involved in cell wall biosynthesis